MNGLACGATMSQSPFGSECMPSVDIDHPRCPYCHAAVKPGDGAKQSCGDCMAWHHSECWQDHGGCSACNQTQPATAPSDRTGKVLDAPADAVKSGSRALGVGLASLAFVALAAWAIAEYRVPPPPAPMPGVEAPAPDTRWHERFLGATSEEEKTRWCRVGAEGGDPAAMNLLGFRLAGGIGCQTDFEEAVLWGRKGAELGHGNAMFGYARMLEGGFGVARDPEHAAYWYRRAVAAGDPQAPHHLEALLNRHPDLRAAPTQQPFNPARPWVSDGSGR